MFKCCDQTAIITGAVAAQLIVRKSHGPPLTTGECIGIRLPGVVPGRRLSSSASPHMQGPLVRGSAQLRDLADRSTLIVIVSAIIQSPGLAVSKTGGAFQCVIANVGSQNILVGADIIISVHERTSIPSI